MNKNNTLVVNLFGAPGSGKSTGAAYIFSKLKMMNINAELVTEFAKEKVWEENENALEYENQCYVFGEQFYRLKRLIGKVDVIVTDSPILLSAYYNQSTLLGKDFNKVVFNLFSSFDNVNLLIKRNKPYNPKGRIHTQEQSDLIHISLKKMLDDYKLGYTEYNGDIENYDLITKYIKNRLNKRC